jgi:hypothetical protein
MEEKVLMEGVANPLSKRGFAFKNGKGVLTNKRFIYCKHKLSKTLIIGVWINLTKGDYEYDIPLENIKKIQIESKGIRGHVLHLHVEGEPIKKYGIMKPLDWEIAFNNALSNDSVEKI